MKYCLFIICITILISCKKESDTDLANNADKIFYVDIEPDFEIQTVKSYETHEDNGWNCYNIPLPNDSVVEYELDLNTDGTNDYKIKVMHGEIDVDTHCRSFTYLVTIEGLKEDNEIAISEKSYQIAGIYDVEAEITKNYIWVNKAHLRLTGNIYLVFETDFKAGFIGLKMNNNYGYLEIAPMTNNGISFLSFAYNETENNSIICGQKD